MSQIISARLSNIIASVVTGVWAISFTADIVLKDYDPSPMIHLVMMAVVGSALGSNLFKKAEDEK